MQCVEKPCTHARAQFFQCGVWKKFPPSHLGDALRAQLATTTRNMQASCTPTTSRALPGSRMLCRPALRTRRACQPLAAAAGSGAVTLEVKGLTATIAATGQQILNGVNLTIREGEVHAIMGKNGSGKSTLSKVLVGHPDYEVTGGSATFKGKDLFAMDPEERSHAGESPCRMAVG